MKHLVKALALGTSRYAQQPQSSWKTGASEPATTGMRAWLLNGTGYVNVCHRSANEIAITSVDNSWAEANASDLIANREAALESLHPRQHPEYTNRSVAWPIVTSYYAAYFATQSLMRCLGLGTIYIESDESRKIDAAWKIKGFSPSLTAGNYGFKVELATPPLIVLNKMSGGGGAHSQFWSGFAHSQKAIHTAILVSTGLAALGSTERQWADAEYTKLVRQCFSSSDSGTGSLNFSWLTELRNEINYRFSGNVWLMNWRHSAGLIANHQGIIDRYITGNKSLPNEHRKFKRTHLVFVAAKLCQLVQDATTSILIK